MRHDCTTRCGEGSKLRALAVKALSAALVVSSIPAMARAKPASNTIETIEMKKVETGRELVIHTKTPPTFSVFRLADPFRILVDVNDAVVAPALDLQRFDGDGVLRYVATQKFSDELSSIVRVEIALEADAPYDVQAVGDSIVVRVTAKAVAQPGAEAAPSPTQSDAPRAAAPAGQTPVLGKLEKKVSGSVLVLSAPIRGGVPAADATHIEHVADPDRLVIDVAGVTAEPKWQKLNVNQRGIARARVGVQDGSVRLVLDLSPGAALPEVDVVAEHGRLAVRLSPVKAKPKVEPILAETKPEAEREAPAAKVAAKPEATAKVAEAPKAKPASNRVKDVRFENKDGFVRLTVELTKDFTAIKDSSSTRERPLLRIAETAIPEALVRTLDTTQVAKGIVSAVSTYDENGDLLIGAQVGGDTEHRHWQKGNKLYWDFRSKAPAPAAVAAAPKAEILEYPTQVTSGYQSQLAAKTGLQVVQQRRSYSGRRISLDLKDAEVQNVLRLLADVSKLNIVAGDDVRGKITLKLTNVPWDQALDIILQSRQLDKVRNGNIIRVAPLEVLEKEAQLRQQRREALEKSEPLSVRLIPVSYAVAADIKPQVGALLSARGKVNIDKRTNVLVVEDIPDVLLKVERMVRTLDTQTPQVLIEARIVQALSNFGRELGIQWGGEFNASQQFGNDTGLTFPNSIRIAGGSDDNANQTGGTRPDPSFAVNLPAAVGTGAGGSLGFTFGSAGQSTIIALRLTAAERDGKTKIISSPKIVTLDNKKAKILSGEKIPITVLTANGPSTRFIDANLELEVTPHVTSDGSILLSLKATQNQVNEQRKDILGTPGIIVREAETEMLIKDGDTAVLGGIYKRAAAEARAYVPFLGDIPVLGWIFKRTSRTDDRDELLIFISPRIINRSEALVQGS